MEDKGLLYRTHGSASPVNPLMGDRAVTEKEKIRITEKTKIGIAATKLITDNDSIILNSGSTICVFAEQIKGEKPLMVVTSSIKATTILSEFPNISILQLGGQYQRRSMSTVSNMSIKFLEDIACSKLFLGVDGIDPTFGVTTSNLEEAALNKAMMHAALKIVILCDSSKFGKRGFGKICDLDKIDIIITDDGISDSMKKYLEEEGVEVIIAE